MLPRLPLVVCALGLAFGCAAEEVDGGPQNPGGGNAPSSAGTTSGTGGTTTTTGGKPNVAGTTGSSGTPTGGTGSGTAGTGTSGSGGASSTGGNAGGGTTSGTSGTSGTSTGGKPGVSLPFTEDFEDGQANGFMPWNEDMTQGTWAVVADGAGKVYQPMATVSELEFAVGGVTAWTDVALKVKVKLANDQSDAQVVLRFKDPKTYLFVEMAEGKYKLRGRANGSSQDLVAPSPKPVIVAGTWYTVGITAKGTSVSLTLDDMPIGSPATCDALISNGGVALGVAEGSVAFDDLSIVAAP